MISHTYDFERKDVLMLAGAPLAPVVLFALLMHLAGALRILPAPRPALDVDSTLLVHQVEASRARPDADVLLLGDSSCLMDVSARELARRLGVRVLNLGTHSYLDLNSYADLLREYATAHPRGPRAVVLLLHPEALRRMTPEPYHVALFQSLLRGRDPQPGPDLRESLLRMLGLEMVRTRILARLIPAPLHGAYGRYYGFSRDLDEYLTQNQGSAVDPEPRPSQGDPEYRLAPQIEAGSRSFRAAVPAGSKLLVGITPVPAGFAARDYQATRDQMLRQWCKWLQADVALADLPATLPDGLFAKTAHLSAEGAQTYTEALARLLKPYLP
jgi:hypothetical protein